MVSIGLLTSVVSIYYYLISKKNQVINDWAKPRNIGLPAIHTGIDRVFRKNLPVEEDPLGIRDIGLKREPKKDLSCIILHNLECYQFRYVDQMIQCKQKFLDSWRYRTTYKLSCLHIHHLSLQQLFQ